MSSPVWDGEGKDPWLPVRLNARLKAAEDERNMFEVVWAQLAAWLVSVQRAVKRGPVMQPEAIFSRSPAWYRAVDVIIEKAVMPIMGQAYNAIFGPDYQWQRRPNVISYLAQVKNRMVNTPQEVFDLVAGQIAAGVTIGEGIPELTARMDDVLSTTGTPRWENRAVVIARTETLGALNGSRFDAFSAAGEESETSLERMWLATDDTRTRPTHRVADGQRAGLTEPFMVGGFSLMFPGDPAGPPQEVIQCRCTTILLEVGETVDLSNRQMKRG
jgi:uncharacterized protein with gpF-like domain